METLQHIQFMQHRARTDHVIAVEAAVARRVEAEMRRFGVDRVRSAAGGSGIGVIEGYRSAAIPQHSGIRGIQIQATISLGETVAYSGTTPPCKKFFPAWRLRERARGDQLGGV